MRNGAHAGLVLSLAALAGCTGSTPGEGPARVEPSSPGAAPTPAPGAPTPAPNAPASDGGSADGGALARVTTRVITTAHRAVPGVMFGGWGPHLGHLVRRPSGELWFVDDACEPASCSVDANARVDAFRLDGAAWTKRATVALPTGIQQNTGTIATSDGFESYGVDVVTSRIVVCRLAPDTLASACAPIPLSLPPSTNYVGAALSPAGWKMTWATTVKDGGGGSFHWLVDYGGGWNGPRTGSVGGYNDASYVNVAFAGSKLVAFAQLVGGLAPAWTFHGAVADGDLATSAPLDFALLPAAGGEPVASTNDVVFEPGTNDAHLVARTAGGAAALFFRPSGGAWSLASVVPGAFRARFVQLADGRLVLVHGKAGRGLAMRVAPAGRAAGQGVAWGAIPEEALPLPEGYEDVYAIYPESASTQRTLPPAIELAVVGAKREHEVLHVHVER